MTRTASGPVSTVLFDVDGTLVDSNYLHVDAWQRAFADAGQHVEAWRIHRAIGMDGESLLDRLADPGSDRHALSSAHSAHYRNASSRLERLPGARELIEDLHERGVTVVLATSAPEAELELLLKTLALGFTPLTTNADDVDEAKPHPGIIQVALQRADATPETAVMIGDAMWDMVAARKARVRAIGVRSGGVGADELVDAGAEEVVDGVAELLDRGDRWPA